MTGTKRPSVMTKTAQLVSFRTAKISFSRAARVSTDTLSERSEPITGGNDGESILPAQRTAGPAFC